MHTIVGVHHYENFPVASVLCPAALRPAVVAIYGFARTADDIADEGDAPADERVAMLQAYQADLHAIYQGRPASDRWALTFLRLDEARRRHDIPRQPLEDLLAAFLRDTQNPRYETRADLLGYCRLSANPIGRLLLHLYRHEDERSLEASDAICTALQLINFWQDLSVDLPRQRVYIPAEDARRHGLCQTPMDLLNDSEGSRRLVEELCSWTHQLMDRGQSLALELPGRAGWELRVVVQGGLRILEKIRRMQYRTLHQRPVLTALDAPTLLWRSVRMGLPVRDKKA